MRPGMANVGSWSKVATIATKLPFELLFSLCSLFLRNLTVDGGAAVLAAICLPVTGPLLSLYAGTSADKQRGQILIL